MLLITEPTYLDYITRHPEYNNPAYTSVGIEMAIQLAWSLYPDIENLKTAKSQLLAIDLAICHHLTLSDIESCGLTGATTIKSRNDTLSRSLNPDRGSSYQLRSTQCGSNLATLLNTVGNAVKVSTNNQTCSNNCRH